MFPNPHDLSSQINTKTTYKVTTEWRGLDFPLDAVKITCHSYDGVVSLSGPFPFDKEMCLTSHCWRLFETDKEGYFYITNSAFGPNKVL